MELSRPLGALRTCDALRKQGYDDVKVSDFCIRVNNTTDYQRFLHDIDLLSTEAVRAAFRIPEEYLSQLKFNECLPKRAAEEMMKDRLLQLGRLKTVLKRNRRLILDGFN